MKSFFMHFSTPSKVDNHLNFTFSFTIFKTFALHRPWPLKTVTKTITSNNQSTKTAGCGPLNFQHHLRPRIFGKRGSLNQKTAKEKIKKKIGNKRARENKWAEDEVIVLL